MSSKQTNFRDSPLHELWQSRRDDDRDLKVLITARDSQTGTGKTTLAVLLCKLWDRTGWTADRATLDPGEYSSMYDTLPEGSAILLDEAEQAADNRRSLSSGNVQLSHDWATKRYRQLYTVATMPSVSMLDKRMKELADVRIHVHRRGFAKVYKTKIDDFSGDIFETEMCEIEWGPLDDDPDYQAVEQMKADRMERDGDGDSDDHGDDQPDPDDLRREGRNEAIRRLYEHNGTTQGELADALDLDQSTVSRIVGGES